MSAGPLDGVRVLDLSRLLPGPACTWYLLGLGASVDRVEAPGAGDMTRHMPPLVDGVGAWFAAVSRGKRSVAIDLRRDEGRALVRELVPRYDVLVEGFRPGVLEEMGLAPDVLHAVNPRLVVARLSGYGQTGPWRDRPGHDLNYVGESGLLALPSHVGGAPALPANQVADFGAALVAAMGIASALYERERTGTGRVLDVALAEAALSQLAPVIAGFDAECREPIAGGELLTGGLPLYRTYRCQDGRFITVGALEPKFQQQVAAATGTLDADALAAVFLTRPAADWAARLGDACVGTVRELRELADHPQHAARGAVVRSSGTSWVVPPFGRFDAAARVPRLGEHTTDVLAEAGLTLGSIADLRRAGVIT